MKVLYLAATTKPEFDNTINKVLQGREYIGLRNPISDLIQKLKAALMDWLTDIIRNTFSGIKSAGAISEGISTLFMITGILILLALIIVVIIRVSRTLNRNTKISEILGEKIDERTTPESLRNKAASFYREGDFRQAIRYDFIAVLLLMHNERVIFLDEAKTNQEIYNYLSRNKFPLVKAFNNLKDTFNLAWYGDKGCSEEDYNNWSDNLRRLWNEVVKQ